jgi:adenylylsulfate kinase-like enzyme
VIDSIPVVVITGPVGAGKSTVTEAIQEELAACGVTCAAIDQDYLRMVQPTPPGDRFGSQLGYRNLAAIWPNLLEAGVRVAVIADVVEDRAQSLAAYGAAMPGGTITIVRLDVPMPLILERLVPRERTPDGLAWSQSRAPELQAIMEAGAVEDILVNVGERTPREIAREIIDRVGIVQRVT